MLGTLHSNLSHLKLVHTSSILTYDVKAEYKRTSIKSILLSSSIMILQKENQKDVVKHPPGENRLDVVWTTKKSFTFERCELSPIGKATSFNHSKNA